MLYRCATTAVQIFQVEFVRDALLKLFPESIVSKLDPKIPDVRKWTDFVKLLLKSEKQINSFLEASSQVHQDLFLSYGVSGTQSLRNTKIMGSNLVIHWHSLTGLVTLSAFKGGYHLSHAIYWRIPGK